MKLRTSMRLLLVLLIAGPVARPAAAWAAESELVRVGFFAVDASPPIGSPLAYDPCRQVVLPLSARGIVLLGSESPIVLCAVDWIGIGNDGNRQWREALARAASTSPNRVSVHTLHQHDAPSCDMSAERLLAEHGLGGLMFDVAFARRTIDKVAAAVGAAAGSARPVTHLGLGQAKVDKVASNRRILGPDGRVRAVRYTTCSDPKLRAEPAGVIDPYVKSISFWNDETPLVVLTYFATHPQSYYRTGKANPDFPGMARLLREFTLNGLPHVHFNGAGGNIGAGKYNDGGHENRQILALRMAEGMARAWQATKKIPLAADEVGWDIEPVAIPAAPHLDQQRLLSILDDAARPKKERIRAARDLAWLRRCLHGETIDISCLRLGPARVVHLPGEAVVEYQLAAQKMQPDLFVAVAAYGDYGPGYICLQEHYRQGGYEDSPRASRVAPTTETVLMPALERLLAP
ncbi:MAG: hypothetical protein BMS9Abin04_479 [Planctomycetia bacterium]|nr:MAG: hypothetical protein BMS9Abin04_479 [Planctomycetia bacterium]